MQEKILLQSLRSIQENALRTLIFFLNDSLAGGFRFCTITNFIIKCADNSLNSTVAPISMCLYFNGHFRLVIWKCALARKFDGNLHVYGFLKARHMKSA